MIKRFSQSFKQHKITTSFTIIIFNERVTLMRVALYMQMAFSLTINHFKLPFSNINLQTFEKEHSSNGRGEDTLNAGTICLNS